MVITSTKQEMAVDGDVREQEISDLKLLIHGPNIAEVLQEQDELVALVEPHQLYVYNKLKIIMYIFHFPDIFSRS
jgi:hypothetical protein